MLTNDHKALIAMCGVEEICILPQMGNRHGLITGATGTGKTVSLQTMAETFSSMGVPVLMADVKGDLSGVAATGVLAGKPGERVKQMNLPGKGYKNQSFPVCFWDVFGKNGLPLRATISDVGPLILARLLGLNEVQSGILQMIFRIADDNGLLLLDLKDLRSMAQHVSDERDQYKASYGQISPASVGAIQRALLTLEAQGADKFFGEPALDVQDLMHVVDGKGVINILESTALINSPSLYTCVLLWLLSELFDQLPEIGDQPQPRLVLFFDEAHLMFDEMPAPLLQKIEQVVRLIRSRGVGIFFVSQNPSDMPDSILGQLGNRIQHAIRAFTPKDRKSVRAAAEAFRPNPNFSTEEAISNLGVGEALVSFLDANGAPAIVEKCLIVPPEAHIGPIAIAERIRIAQVSPLAPKYARTVDRESAYEILTARSQWMEQANAVKEQARARKEAEAEAKRQEREQKRAAREAAINDPIGNILGSIARQTTRTVTTSVAREIGRAVFGNGTGGKISASIVRGILGGILGVKK